MPGDTQYRAFISYSHVDKVFARKLHRSLEGYRVPRHLVGTETPRGIVSERLTPIFRDIDELPASGDLTAEIKAALAASESLIVLCSPHARASQWVEREIKEFRALHGASRPIFAAIINGEPQDVLPVDLLNGVDPIAADFRKGIDGANLAQLKLVAGLTGLGLGELVQRDAQRRIRRVMAITALAGVAVIAMASLMVLALRAQAEAERQRGEAEGLIEYMLTDLRERLDGVGRIDVMAAVNERAMAYYTSQQSLRDLSKDSLERRARILHAMGEDDERRADLPAARKKFLEAHRTTAAILAANPQDPEALFAHAQSEYWVGRIAELSRQWQQALQHYRHYGALAQRLLAVQPDNPRSMMEMAWGHSNTGMVQLNGLKNASAAQLEFEQALTWMRKASAQGGDKARIVPEIAETETWLADSYYTQDQTQESLNHRLAAQDIFAANLKADPRNAAALYVHANNERAIGQHYVRLERYDDAVAILKKAEQSMTRLVALEPENVDFRFIALKIANMLFVAYQRSGNVAEAQIQYDQTFSQSRHPALQAGQYRVQVYDIVQNTIKEKKKGRR